MNFKHVSPADFGYSDPNDKDGAATVAQVENTTALLCKILNELRVIRAHHLSLPDPDDLQAQEDKG